MTTNWAVGSHRMRRGGWILIGLGWLVRPELVLFSIAIAAGIVVMERADRGLPRALLASGWAWLLPALYQVFRMGYYASIFPNTAYAKAADLTRWGLGWDYLRQFVDNYALGLAALCLVVAGYAPLLARGYTRRPRQFALVSTWLLGTVLVTLYIVRVGGDYVEARLLLPSFFAFCAPVAVVRVSSHVKAQSVLRVAAVFTLAAWALVAATTLRPKIRYRTTIDNPATNVVVIDKALDPPLARVYDVAAQAPLSFEGRRVEAARNPALPRRTAGLSGIGVVSYALGTNVDVFDIGGLADPPTAHFSLPSRALPGHEKFVPPPWAAARLLAPGAQAPPQTFVNVNFLVRPLIPRTTGAAYQRQVEQARHALSCGALHDLLESYQGHFGIGGFLRNVVHSVSYSRITVPPDPAAAEQKFCG